MMETGGGRRGRILIVDDDPALGATVQRILAREHEATLVASAAEALRRVTGGEAFDVILCDLLMPAMSGMDLHAALLKQAPGQAARMAFMTGGAFTDRARAFLDRVPNPSIGKPFLAEELLGLVRGLVG
jgi:CheY-like chemotaxis protein